VGDRKIKYTGGDVVIEGRKERGERGEERKGEESRRERAEERRLEA
jgi:hypothetical protein